MYVATFQCSQERWHIQGCLVKESSVRKQRREKTRRSVQATREIFDKFSSKSFPRYFVTKTELLCDKRTFYSLGPLSTLTRSANDDFLFQPSRPNRLIIGYRVIKTMISTNINKTNNSIDLFASPSSMATYLSPALGSRNRAGVKGNLVREKHRNLKKTPFLVFFLFNKIKFLLNREYVKH